MNITTSSNTETIVKPADIITGFSFNELKGLKVLFVNMPLREGARPNVPPQGPALLASRLRMHGAAPCILDLNAYRIETSEKEKKQHRLLNFDEAEELLVQYLHAHGDQDIIAFSGMITTLRWQEQFAKISRKHQPKTFLISGGGLATQLKENLFAWVDELDAVAHSEGDDIILIIGKDVINKKNSGRPFNNSSNPYYIGEISNKDRFLYAGDRSKNLDELPLPAWDLLEKDVNGNEILEQYINTPVWGSSANNSSSTPFSMTRSLTTVSSRGCPYECTFCYRGAQGERLYGIRSAKNLADEVRWLIDKYNIDFVGFPDDNFAVDKGRIRQLPSEFEELNIRWGTHTRLDEADSRLEPMAKSGCIYIGYGAESASENVLNAMKKGGFMLRNGITKINGYRFPTTMVDGIVNTRNNGIHSNCTWIMGFPEETLEDLKISVAFIEWQKELVTNGLRVGTEEYKVALNSINQNMFVATAYPGTEMFEHSVVRDKLHKNFGINFDNNYNPSIDENYKKYILELDDATKLLSNSEGDIINYGAIPDDTFKQIRNYVEQGKLSSILDI